MKSLNLFDLTRIPNNSIFYKYEKILSKRELDPKEKPHEVTSLKNLLESFEQCGAVYENFSYFYFSYEIPQLGTEFDLLRIGSNKIINIELKSENVNEDKIKKQLIKNKHYLSHISDNVKLYTFISSVNTFYQLEDSGDLKVSDVKSILDEIIDQKDCFSEDINILFKPSKFLVSPISTPIKFLSGKYILTPQQNDFKQDIEKKLYEHEQKFIAITGSPGTGKTLFLYDLAKQYSIVGRCCIIHCGILSQKHSYLNSKLESIDIVPAKSINENLDLSQYKYLFLDESHRFYKEQFDTVIDSAIMNNIHVIFSYDSKQILSKNEQRLNISLHIESLPQCEKYKLSNKIRTNKELASFIHRLMNLNSSDIFPCYPSVSLAYANNNKEAKIILRKYRSLGYKFIDYTKSNYAEDIYKELSAIKDHDTHHVIGQEFDNVLMVMGKTFHYNTKNKLVGDEHPNPNYLYLQLLYQGLTRVREKLAIIVIDNSVLFENILSILN